MAKTPQEKIIEAIDEIAVEAEEEKPIVVDTGPKSILKKPKSYLNEKQIKPIFKQIVKAINYIHSMDLIHKDLRLEKIILN